MEYRNLGRTGLKVAPLCLGTMQFGWTAGEDESFEVLSAAFEAGITFIDTANIYSRWVEGNPGGIAEQIIGKWMRKAKIPRDQIVLATKVRGAMGTGPNDQGLSRLHILNAVEESLRRLGTDYLDLYQSHFYDERTPIEETLSAFDQLVRDGKVRYVGCSNYSAWRLMESLWRADVASTVRYDCLQPHYNLAHRAEFERELAEVCRRYGLGVIPYSPLAGGFLTGKYRQDDPVPASSRASGVRGRYFNERGWSILDEVMALSEQKEASPSQISLAWMLADPLITSPIIGPRNLDQLADNLASLEVSLTAEEKARLDQVSAWN